LEWIYEFFKKLEELINVGAKKQVSFSFNEFWAFLKNEVIESEYIQNKITQFKIFFTSNAYLLLQTGLINRNPKTIFTDGGRPPEVGQRRTKNRNF
jgi:hypothetical protein